MKPQPIDAHIARLTRRMCAVHPLDDPVLKLEWLERMKLRLRDRHPD